MISNPKQSKQRSAKSSEAGSTADSRTEQCERRLDEVLDSMLFKTLSEPVRCRILRILALRGPMSITEVARHFPCDRSVISRHLALMCRNKLCVATKWARQRMYHVDGAAFLEKLETMSAVVRELINFDCDSDKG